MPIRRCSHPVAAQKDAASPDFDRLRSAYVETRRDLAKNFRELANSVLVKAGDRINNTRQEIETRMQRKFGGIAPRPLAPCARLRNGPCAPA